MPNFENSILREGSKNKMFNRQKGYTFSKI